MVGRCAEYVLSLRLALDSFAYYVRFQGTPHSYMLSDVVQFLRIVLDAMWSLTIYDASLSADSGLTPELSKPLSPQVNNGALSSCEPAACTLPPCASTR